MTDATVPRPSDPAAAAPKRLSPRQAECLRLVHRRRTSKEIAAITDLAVGTVDTYIAESVAALGARNRRHAAEIFHALETPGKLEPEFTGVDPATVPGPAGLPPRQHVGWADLLPLRRNGAPGNDLRPLLRLGWILGLAALLAIGFGMLAVGADVVGRLFAGR